MKFVFNSNHCYYVVLIRKSEILSQVWKLEQMRVVQIGIKCSNSFRIRKKEKLQYSIVDHRSLPESFDTNAISLASVLEKKPFNILENKTQ